MEKKIAVIACSNAELDYIKHDYDVRIFRSTLHLGDEDYLDYVDISADEFYKRLEEDTTIFPTSSYYPLGKMIEMYEDLVKDGYTHCIVVSISQHMSGIYNASMMAAKEVEGLEVYSFDSRSVTYPQAIMVLRACEMIEEGKDIPEILEELEYIRDNNKIYFVPKTLLYLIKNGRLSNASGFIANTLKIKPVLTISKEGKVESFDKIRTFKKAVNRLVELFDEETKGKDVIPFIIHANNYETKDFITEKIKEIRPEITEVPSVPLTAVVGAHGGPGTIGLGYYIKRWFEKNRLFFKIVLV